MTLNTIVLPQELPGKAAHLKLAPEPRVITLIKEQTPPSNAKESAVLVLLNPTGTDYLDWTVLLIKRNTYHGVHSGQIAFPGGKCDSGDVDYTHTACREANEELAIERDKISIVGNLSRLYVPPSNFTIYPVLAINRGFGNYVPNRREVLEYLTVPVKLFNPRLSQRCKVMAGPYEWVHAPGYLYQNHVIWGATAMILCELYEVLQSITN